MGNIETNKFIEPPMSYTGSKFKILEQLLPLFDYSKPTFIDMFVGGGSVYSNVLPYYDKVIINDIISDLVEIHKSLIISDDIIEKTKSICPQKDNQKSFLDLRNDYNQNPTPEKLWALMLSSTNNMIRFNQKFKYNQTFGKRTWNSNIEQKAINFTNHLQKYNSKVKFLSENFNNIQVIDNAMYYIDPPYSNTEAGYNAFWKKDDDIKLYNYIHNINNIGSSFMLSGVLIHDDVKSQLLEKLIIDGFNYKKIDFNYNKVSRKGKKETEEIVIFNY